MENTTINQKRDGRAGRKVELENKKDIHLDFDMFDFIYSIVSYVDPYSIVKNPVSGKKHSVPASAYRDDEDAIYLVSADGNSYVTANRRNIEEYDAIKDILDYCHIDYEEPKKGGTYAYFEWSMRINVPMEAVGYPKLLEDYCSDIGITIDDVMPESWCKVYRSKISKLNAEMDELDNDRRLEKAFNKAVTYAWQRGDIDLNTHWKDLEATLVANGIKYKKINLKKRFMAEFEEEDD